MKIAGGMNTHAHQPQLLIFSLGNQGNTITYVHDVIYLIKEGVADVMDEEYVDQT